MDSSQMYILLGIVVLAVIALLVFYVNKGKKKEGMSKLAGIAFGFVIAGIIFSEDRMISYGLMGIGVILAVIDIIMKSRKK
jgi:heme/copper-type cytochrome/quinol oxidase subunit 1